MSTRLLQSVSLCAIALFANCAVFINPPKATTVKAQNDLTNLSIDVSGTTTNVKGIDLVGVAIGDVFFPAIDYGTVTSARTTDRSGAVTITIDTAKAWALVLGVYVPVAFSNITPMSADITAEKENTVVFDETTAGTIFSALAKKMAPKSP